MTAEQKHTTLLEEAEKNLRQLPPESIKVAIAFLAYLHKTEAVPQEIAGDFNDAKGSQIAKINLCPLGAYFHDQHLLCSFFS